MVRLLLLPLLFAISVAEVPNPQSEHSGWVSDTAGTIDPSDERLLERSLQQIFDETGVEVALVTVQDCSETPKAFAGALFEQWKIGDSETDKGLLILMVTSQRRLEMEVGYGLEGELPDAWVVGMQRQHMVPWFKKDQYGLGLLAGVARVAGRLGVSALPQASEAEKASKEESAGSARGAGDVEVAASSGGLAELQARIAEKRQAQAEAFQAELNRSQEESDARELRLREERNKAFRDKLSLLLFLLAILGVGLGAGLLWVRMAHGPASSRPAPGNRSRSSSSSSSSSTSSSSSSTSSSSSSSSSSSPSSSSTSSHSIHSGRKGSVSSSRKSSSGSKSGGSFGGGRSGGGGGGSSW